MILVVCTLAAPSPKADPRARPQFYTSAISPLHTVSSYTPYVQSSYVVPAAYVSPHASFYSGLCKDVDGIVHKSDVS